MSNTFQLGQRVKITGTAYLRKNASPEQWDEAPLPTLNIAPTPVTYDTGVIVGSRTVMNGWTYGGYDEPMTFTPAHGTARRVWLVAFHLRRKPVMCFDHQVEALPMPESVTVPTPHIPHPGFHTQGHFMRTAARNIKNDHPVGGYNVTTAVIKLLTDTAEAMENNR